MCGDTGSQAWVWGEPGPNGGAQARGHQGRGWLRAAQGSTEHQGNRGEAQEGAQARGLTSWDRDKVLQNSSLGSSKEPGPGKGEHV